jgi:hypothetical protein
MLVYFIVQPGLVTDFSQPPQLFALAINSPPARVLAGSCGTGPEGKQYKTGWVINHEGEHLFMQPYSDQNSALLHNEYDSGSFQLSNVKAGKSSGSLLFPQRLVIQNTAYGHLRNHLRSITPVLAWSYSGIQARAKALRLCNPSMSLESSNLGDSTPD